MPVLINDIGSKLRTKIPGFPEAMRSNKITERKHILILSDKTSTVLITALSIHEPFKR